MAYTDKTSEGTKALSSFSDIYGVPLLVKLFGIHLYTYQNNLSDISSDTKDNYKYLTFNLIYFGLAGHGLACSTHNQCTIARFEF